MGGQAPPSPAPDLARAVPMSSGEALSYVHSDTASQVLCNALPETRLRTLLNSNMVVRERLKGTCRISDERKTTIDLTLQAVWEKFAPNQQVGGRPAQVNVSNKVVIDVSIAETDGYRSSSKRTPILRALASANVESTVRGLLDELVPVLARQSTILPEVDDDGTVAFASTPLTAGEFIDLPRPVQVLQLCTVAEQTLNFEVIKTIENGTCTLRKPDDTTLALVVVDSVGSAGLTDRIAGRPAKISESSVTVRLRDDALLDLMIGDTDPAIAEKLVQALAQG
ncbi:hypothetical protein LWC34_01125 [Kibdelosporangium philippinense]|uniref:Uncharacterized protein n=1 Tax=Kibdelosporangium philippinense TaxID=211113 RepID=A0ABS8Z0F1_9PSEU|nr:hypothetical protein [Kibdelosporangium philippinense]MCE7001448.1 hypothetical protein [Kibdelosporangium philippinense]